MAEAVEQKTQAQTGDQVAGAQGKTEQAAQAVESKVDQTAGKSAEELAAIAAADADKKTEVKVPDKYDLKIPEGSLLKPEEVDKISAYAKAKGLSNEQAQEELNKKSDAVKEYHSALETVHGNSVKEWADKSATDKEFGGENFGKNAELAKRALEKFGSPELKEILNKTGYGNHPELVRFMYRVGKAMGDDSFVSGSKIPGAQKSIAEKFYGAEKT
jgi:hypothetical protein